MPGAAPPAARRQADAPAAAPAGDECLSGLLRRWGRTATPRQATLSQLAQWLDWTDALRLAQALALGPSDAAPAMPARQEDAPQPGAARQALARLQAELLAGFDDPLLGQESAQALAEALPLADALAPYRLHHAQQQRAMAARVAELRQRLRCQWAGNGGARERELVALDAVFERTMAAHEARALAGLAALLFGARAERHRQADPARWRSALWRDLQDALRAELAQRVLAVQGLIDALGAAPGAGPPPGYPA